MAGAFSIHKRNTLSYDVYARSGVPGDRRRPPQAAGRDSKPSPMNLIKSKRRVADHGEVFTPRWMVEAMLDLVKGETERIDSRFLEPACGSGNFLVPVLQRKLAAVEAQVRQVRL